jgi:hypothetical protein
MASVKNFQLVLSDPIADYPNGPSAQEMLLKRDEAQDFIMQMGKVSAVSRFRHSSCDSDRLRCLVCLDDRGLLQYGLQIPHVSFAVLCDLHRQVISSLLPGLCLYLPLPLAARLFA